MNIPSTYSAPTKKQGSFNPGDKKDSHANKSITKGEKAPTEAKKKKKMKPKKKKEKEKKEKKGYMAVAIPGVSQGNTGASVLM